MFDPVDPRQRLPALEEGILKYWQEEDIFKRSLRQRMGDIKDVLGPVKGDHQEQAFSFYDGPPFATGLPHYGHLLAGTIKDVIPRYQTMRGKYVQRRFGWDCHGLPVENIVEKEQNLSSRKDIEMMGVAAFNELCRTAVQRYTKEWRIVVERMGRFVDMDWDYRTMDPEFMESIWWVFSQLHTKGLIYEGKKAMQVCPRCVTPLANFEVTQGYKDVSDMSVTWKFELSDKPETFLLAWTTTPWSTLSTMGLSISPNADYVKVRTGKEYLIFAKERLEAVMKGIEDYEVIEEFKGKKMVGKHYVHIAPWYADLPEVKAVPHVYSVFAADYVEVTEGTGIVTINGSYGEIDMEAAKKNTLPIVMDVNMDGHFNTLAGPYSGQYVKDGEKKIIEDCNKKGLVWKKESYTHSYPHCWRCETPLLNYATSSWFVNVTKIKSQLLLTNAETEWVPAHIRDGRFGKWLEGARDWAISRNRYWGTPLPIWRQDPTSRPALRGEGKDKNPTSQQHPSVGAVPASEARNTMDLEVIGSRSDLMAHCRIRFTKVTAVRHGESEGNITPVYQGKVPGTNLTAAGKEQAARTAETLDGQEIAVIYCSPLARTQQTAQAIADRTGATVIVDERLQEVQFGEYEGKSIDFSDLTFVKAKRAHKLESGTPESIYHFPGMETWQDVQNRIKSFMEEKLPLHRGEHIVVVTHADPVQNLRHFFNREDPVKLSHQPYPGYAEPYTFYWDHAENKELDLHKHIVDDIVWPGGPSESDVEITFVRHGESEGNRDDLLQGSEGDPALTEKGKREAEMIAKSLKNNSYDVILSSDAKRTTETATIISKNTGIAAIEWLLLRGRSLGKWSGRPVKEIGNLCSIAKGNSLSLFAGTPPGGETLSQFLRRAQEICEKLLKEYPGKRVLIVMHGGLACAMRAILENLSYRESAKLLKNAESTTYTLHPFVRRIPEVLDCWFESGSMPYAQNHFPFNQQQSPAKKTNNQQLLTMNSALPPGFPADFIAEGIDQTRGWFYTLMILSTALFDKPAFRHCIVNGIVLAEDGKKMSKRLKNYPEPLEVVHRRGADAVRFTLMASPAVRGEDLRFSEKLVEETVRSVLLPLWNVYSFFVTYANAAKYESTGTRRHSAHPLDRYIRAEAQDLVNRMTRELERFDLSATCAEIHDTIDALTNWYVRLSRRRFAGKAVMEDEDLRPAECETDQKEECLAALGTLEDVLLTVCQVLAPFCPFITDAIYLNLVAEDHGSIHLTDWPEPRNLTLEEKNLLEKNRLLRVIVSLGHRIRSGKKIKVRQPLSKATIALPPAFGNIVIAEEDRQLLRSELNVKVLEFTDNPEALAERIAMVDARKTGPRLGKRVQEIIKAGKAGEFTVKEDGSVLILDEVLAPDEVQVIFRGKEGQDVLSEGGVVVGMDLTITEELKREADARELIRLVQRLRKDAGLAFTDRIALSIEGMEDVMKDHGNSIAEETNAVLEANEGEAHEEEIEGVKVGVRFAKRN
ncbi:MAG: class I tRNA ligase family protein [Candidatus Peregrinibacteria bacterium]